MSAFTHDFSHAIITGCGVDSWKSFHGPEWTACATALLILWKQQITNTNYGMQKYMETYILELDCQNTQLYLADCVWKFVSNMIGKARCLTVEL